MALELPDCIACVAESRARVITPVGLFALVAMTTASSYPVTAEAAEDSQALYWSRYELMDFVLRVPQMAMNAMRIMAEQLQEIQERFRNATTERVERRLVHTLMRLAAQSGKRVKEGILINLPLTRQDLAEISGPSIPPDAQTVGKAGAGDSRSAAG